MKTIVMEKDGILVTEEFVYKISDKIVLADYKFVNMIESSKPGRYNSNFLFFGLFLVVSSTLIIGAGIFLIVSQIFSLNEYSGTVIDFVIKKCGTENALSIFLDVFIIGFFIISIIIFRFGYIIFKEEINYYYMIEMTDKNDFKKIYYKSGRNEDIMELCKKINYYIERKSRDVDPETEN